MACFLHAISSYTFTPDPPLVAWTRFLVPSWTLHLHLKLYNAKDCQESMWYFHEHFGSILKIFLLVHLIISCHDGSWKLFSSLTPISRNRYSSVLGDWCQRREQNGLPKNRPSVVRASVLSVHLGKPWGLCSV